ncbi:uncharacterized protein N7496_008571 [Penicillium cataractarum]|uniref:Uncharacterized protein n=1 Tax=Penicillium cataractarum TaxID=2100454 RepID=A0A9W9RYZ4_9EURO|nr:uncharacterized protein N7496_008571 [Penicillium cataractarum]KAJ5368811.1 hypothetical protein N7496_008571 [Penicillium cataractarum]
MYSPQIARTPERRQKFEDSRVIQQAAYSLYEAMRTACIAHTVHNVQISLQPALDGTTTRVRFNFAFIKHPKAPGNTVWIDVDSTIKSRGSYSELDTTSCSDGKLSLKRHREVGGGKCSSAIRKRVHFKDLPAPKQVFCSKAEVVEIPNLHIQRNFCRVVERVLDHQERNSCIGLLGDNETCNHLAYLASRASIMQTATSLSDVISRSDITQEKCPSGQTSRYCCSLLPFHTLARYSMAQRRCSAF